MNITKTCTSCNIEYPATLEYFYRNQKGKSGLRPDCKTCRSKIGLIAYNENKEHYKLKFHLYQKKNRVKRRWLNRRERSKRLGLLNDDWTDEQLIATYGTNCYICNEAIDFDAPKRGIGSENSYWPDHLTPTSKGGDNIISNVRPCHSKCNRSKGVKTYEEYLKSIEESAE